MTEPKSNGSADQQEKSRAPFMEHLLELSSRLKRCILYVVVGFVIGYIFSEQIFDFLTRPLMYAVEGEQKLHFSSPIEPFFAYLTVALIAGLFLAAPFVFVEIWRFVAPGLYPREKNVAVPFFAMSAFFFFGGVVFGYFVVFPLGFKFLLSYAYEHPGHFSIFAEVAKLLGAAVDPQKLNIPIASLQPTIMMSDYLSLVAKLLLAFGLVFELPVFIFVLAKIGLVTHRHLIRFFRYFIVIAFIIGAILTPPDVLTQVMMAIPLVIMYTAGIVVAYFITTRRERREAREYEEAGKQEPHEPRQETLEEMEARMPEDRWKD